MKVLVIIPMYNSSKFISECIQSILSQDVKMRIIVVDDASTDDSIKVAKSFKEVEVIRNSINKGTYYSINLGLSLASTDSSWTHFLIHGSDDISHKGRFVKQLSMFNSNTLAIGCFFQRKDFHGGKLHPINEKSNESQLIFLRKVFTSIGYYDSERAGCDTEYKTRLLIAHPNSIRNVDSVLLTAYSHSNNLTKRIPLGGTIRKAYVNSFKRKHNTMKLKNEYYVDFNK
jgi:glycosyltransferase involved in cell wall biosynthesis